jgi:hypothetical protein
MKLVHFLPPLPGLEFVWTIPPTVSPWAIVFRRPRLKYLCERIAAHVLDFAFSFDSARFVRKM